MVIALMWASMAAWFTPTVLFCIMNLIVGTIFIASKSDDTKLHDHINIHVHQNSFIPVVKVVSSFLERARSVNLPPYITTLTTAAESQPQIPSQSKTPKYSSLSRLAQSIHFSSSDANPSTEFSNGDETSESESERQTRQPVHGVKLDQAPSSFDRVKSFKISSASKSGAASTQPENFDTNTGHDPDHDVIKRKSKKSSAKKPVVEMKKSRSEIRIASDDEDDVDLRRPATARARRKADEEEFDAKADDFISKFKQQLKLQRLESLVRFRDMINRGT